MAINNVKFFTFNTKSLHMPVKVFFSWQDKKPAKFNRYFIRECIDEAVEIARQELGLPEGSFIVASDTEDVPGWVNIPTTIEGRIREADIYIADLTYYTVVEEESGKREGVPAPNVSAELFYAKGAIGEPRLITVMNEVYGAASLLPFDYSQNRFGCRYEYNDGHPKPQAKKRLVGCLSGAILTIYKEELEKEKAYIKPFKNWRSWHSTQPQSFPFESNEYTNGLFQQIRGHLDKKNAVLRICGLSCVGKSTLLLECFRHHATGVAESITNSILYVNANHTTKQDVLATLTDLIRRNEDKTLIIDNCSTEMHLEAAQLIRVESSNLKLITVSGNPDEVLLKIDRQQTTIIIRIDNREYRKIVDLLLTKHFSTLDKDDKDKLVEFSNGLPVIADLMAKNPMRPKLHPGSLTYDDIVQNLLGDLYTNPEKRAVVEACSLFSHLGYFSEMKHQADGIAVSRDLLVYDDSRIHADDQDEARIALLREVCDEMLGKGLLEVIGRTISFRPSPLAIRMAEEWWRRCTTTRFARIVPILRATGTLEAFCQQFQHLKHEERAVDVVGQLCDGVFSYAEVLNTEAGSRIFRFFVNVNPEACVRALNGAFEGKSFEDLKAIVAGRRNLIWALERLCFREETFDSAIWFLAAFAIAENENIGNNALGQFVQLFHIYLPGTAADLKRRWHFIGSLINCEIPEYVELSLSAMSSALMAGQFHRMGGAEDQGDTELLKDYQPKTYGEVNEYRYNCLTALAQLSYDAKYSTKAANIVKERFYGLCADSAGRIAIPVFKDFVDRGLISKREAKARVQLAIHSNKVGDPIVLEMLGGLQDQTRPESFEDMFLAWVQSPTPDDYRPAGDNEETGASLTLKIAELATTFYRSAELLENPPLYFVKGHLSEGFQFGKFIGRAIKKEDEKIWNDLVTKLVTNLPLVEPEDRNISILLGILDGVDSRKLDEFAFQTILEIVEIKPFVFAVARDRQLEWKYIDLLLSLTEKDVFSLTLFSNFDRGIGLKHLPVENIREIISRLRAKNDLGKATAFYLLNHWIERQEKYSSEFGNDLFDILLKDSTAILNVVKSSMDLYEWSTAILKVLEDRGDGTFADMLMSLIIDQSNELEYFFNKDGGFSKILAFLEEHYFEIFWKHISDLLKSPGDRGMALYHLKDILGSRHDFLATTTGILFKGGEDHFGIILDWARAQNAEDLSLLASMLPLYNVHPNNADDWHPYAQRFIDLFGDKREVLSGIHSKLHTFSWSGSIVPLLESELKLYEKLINHPIQLVREWAKNGIKEAKNRIRLETDRNQDGYFGDAIVSGSMG